MKKGQLSLQFNWIFIFIVGVVILIFFLYLIRSQTKSSNIELSADIIKNLDTVVKSSQTTTGAEKKIAMPNVKIQFVCEPDTKISFYDLGDGITKDTPYDIIFSQSTLSGTQLISWTQSWDVPFSIAQFQYLTTRNAQFLIVNDAGNFAEELNESLPKGINKKIIQPADPIYDTGYDYYKIIEFSNQHTGIEPAKNVHKIKITIEGGTNTIDSYGTIKFNDSTTISFIKKASLFGAVFSEDADFYKCTMKKAFMRFKTLMTLNYNRTSEMSNSNFVLQSCKNIFSYSANDMKGLLNNELTDSKNIFESSNRIKRDNQNLIRGKNCPLTY